MANIAYAQRRNDELQLLGRLLELTKRYKFIGTYYRGLAIAESGSGDLIYGQRLLEQVSEFAPSQYRAKAALSLGAIEGVRGNITVELQHYARALRIEQADYYTRIEASRAIALIHSVEGDHRRAVEQLETLYPLARHLSRIAPRLYFDLLNSLAVEYAACGRIEEAVVAIRPVILSPLAQSIEEYKQTAAEIAEQQPSRAMVAVALPQPEADTVEQRPRLLIQHRLASPRRLPLALPSPTLARLFNCAPIRAPTARP
jgi:tetratricopeptide (TPR) repeat protein